MRHWVAVLAIIAGTVPAFAQKPPEKNLHDIYRTYQRTLLCKADGFHVTDRMVEVGNSVVKSASQRLLADVPKERQQEIWRQVAADVEKAHREPSFWTTAERQCFHLANFMVKEGFVVETKPEGEIPKAIGELPQ